MRIKSSVPPQEVPFRRRYNLKKADWGGFTKSVGMGITDIVQHLITMDPLWTLSRKHQDITFPVATA